MARIRYLKPDFFNDEDLAEHPFWIRLLFQGLWTIADKEGRLEDRSKRIKVDLFPYDNVDVEKGLCELSKIKNYSIRPFIQRYEANGEKYIAIVNWHKHQKPHHTEKESIIPEPPLLKIIEKGMGNQHEASAGLDNALLTVKEPLKIQHLEFVLLTKEEFEKLSNFLGEQVNEYIKRLNDYIGQIGVIKAKKKYVSHYHTILNWVRRDNPDMKKKEGWNKL
jgi:hypothetical protein